MHLHNSSLILNPITSGYNHVTPFWPNTCSTLKPGLASRISFAKGSAYLLSAFSFLPHLFPLLFRWIKDRIPRDAAESCSSKESDLRKRSRGPLMEPDFPPHCYVQRAKVLMFEACFH